MTDHARLEQEHTDALVSLRRLEEVTVPALEQDNAALRLRVAACEAQLADARKLLSRANDALESDATKAVRRACFEAIQDHFDHEPGSDSALREMMLRAALDGCETIGYGSDEANREVAEAIVSRILGTHKGESTQDHTNQENT